jgi:hypothetical protein
MIGAVLVSLLAAFSVSAPADQPAKQQSQAQQSPRVVVTTSDNGDTRTYVATIFDTDNRRVQNAELDMSAMTGNPDVRVATEPMAPVQGSAGKYQRTVPFPASGDWVLVIRIHAPLQFVHLVTERVDSATLPDADAHTMTPSRQHLKDIAPDFAATYDPMTGIGSTNPQPIIAGRSAAAHHGDEFTTPSTGGGRWNWFWAAIATAVAGLAVRDTLARAKSRPTRHRNRLTLHWG